MNTVNYTVREQQFQTKKEACSYAKIASVIFSRSIFEVKHDGRVVAAYYQGRKMAK